MKVNQQNLNWIDIQDTTKKMPVKKDFYVKFEDGQIKKHSDNRHPKGYITHWALIPEENKIN